MKKIYLIGIGGIGVSALARYYLSLGYSVFGSDAHSSELIQKLEQEGIDIIIGSDKKRIDETFEKVIYSEAIPQTQDELQNAQELGIKTLKYTDAVAEVANNYKLISVAGTHGKSTTTSLISKIFLDAGESFISIVGSILQEFGEKNFYSSKTDPEYFILESCEYKEHFLAYKPTVAVITNIDYDHADYYKTQNDYKKAFEKFIENIIPFGFCIISGQEENSKNLLGKRQDIHYILVFENYFELYLPGKSDALQFHFPKIHMQVPGNHILYDARLAYIVGHMLGIQDETILKSLQNYTGIWRRMEIIGKTDFGNILMSDYGHHPTEIKATLSALKSGYPEKKIFVIFQPHQYSRTLELLEDFKHAFIDADTVIIPNIYESRDSDIDKAKINSKILAEKIDHLNVQDGQGLENTLTLIQAYDRENPDSSIILLLGAGDVDSLRYKIKTHL